MEDLRDFEEEEGAYDYFDRFEREDWEGRQVINGPGSIGWDPPDAHDDAGRPVWRDKK